MRRAYPLINLNLRSIRSTPQNIQFAPRSAIFKSLHYGQTFNSKRSRTEKIVIQLTAPRSISNELSQVLKKKLDVKLIINNPSKL